MRPRLVVAALALIVLAGAGWLAWQAKNAKAELHDAQADLQDVKAALLDGDQQAARAALTRAQQQAAEARGNTDGPLWAVAEHLPAVGSTARSASGLAAVADDLVSGPLQTLVDTAGQVNPQTIWDAKHGVALSSLKQAAPGLQQAARSLTALGRQVRALPASTAIDSVDEARQSMLREVTSLSGTVTKTARIASLAPRLLDHDRYLLVFQNPDEARGTGGLIGAYGVLQAQHGRLRVVRLGPNTDLQSSDAPVIDLGDQFRSSYNGFGATRIWEQANPSPHFPYAARIWLALWQQQTGRRLDGVIATDPVAMSYLLAATGPVSLADGQQIDSQNAVPTILRDAYRRYGTNGAQNAYFQHVAHAVVHQLFAGGADPAALVKQLGKAAGQHRLLVYSTDPRAEAELAETRLGGVLPDKPGPFAELVVNNIAGSKLDYYLDRSLTYDGRGGCTNGQRHTRITATLTNRAPAHGLPRYVTIRADRPENQPRKGTEKLLVSVYLAQQAAMDKITIDGKQGLAGVSTERGHTVVSLTLTLRPGQTRSFTIDVTEPASSRRPQVPVQPLVRPQHTTVHVPPC